MSDQITDFASLSDVKTALRLTTTTDDELLAALITSESSLIANWVSRIFGSMAFTQRFSGRGKSDFLLSNTPVSAITSVVIDGISIPAADSPQGTGYMLIDGKVVLFGFVFGLGNYNCAITYTAGFDSVPADINRACVDLVVGRYKELDRSGLISKGLAGETTTYERKALPDHIKLILQQYRSVTP